MPLRDGVLLLMALTPGLTEDGVTQALVSFLRDGMAPNVTQPKLVRWDGAQVLAAPNVTSRVTGTLPAGRTVQVWRQVGEWCFVSDDSLAGWLHASWLAAG